ncbi:MAG: hypothetical protein QOG04_2150 [Actinomycetota bacterium]|jgi:hypothetical protein|nr:hypothetical protein [Actinomycetota bacterium]
MPRVTSDGVSVYVPTYPADFRCPECNERLHQILTGSRPSLQPCTCGYDSTHAYLQPVPIL